MSNEYSGVAAAIQASQESGNWAPPLNHLSHEEVIRHVYNAKWAEYVTLEMRIKEMKDQLEAVYHAKKEPASQDTVAYYAQLNALHRVTQEIHKLIIAARNEFDSDRGVR